MERIILTEADADEFLESIGVTLYENTMTIGETEVSGIDGQSALREYGIFLYEDGILVEGEQARKYKYRKIDDAGEKENKERERYNTRYGYSRSSSNLERRDIDKSKVFYYPHDKQKYDDYARYDIDRTKGLISNPSVSPASKKSQLDKHAKIDKKANDILDKEETRRNYQYRRGDKSMKYNGNGCSLDYLPSGIAVDALARHIRRHPDQYKESVNIFSSIKFV